MSRWILTALIAMASVGCAEATGKPVMTAMTLPVTASDSVSSVGAPAASAQTTGSPEPQWRRSTWRK